MSIYSIIAYYAVGTLGFFFGAWLFGIAIKHEEGRTGLVGILMMSFAIILIIVTTMKVVTP
jgi:hypothetical protein